MEHLSTYLVTYKVGDHVDIKVNGAIHKGMPHKYYHGKTGRVFNVTKRAVGIEVNKRVGNRIIWKRIHARVEHVKKSRCKEDFKRRVEVNKKRLRAGLRPMKRLPARPKGEKVVSLKKRPQTISPLKFDPMY